MREYTHECDFFWKRLYSEDRMNDIMNWVSELSDEEHSMLEDLMRDASIDQDWNLNAE